MSVVCLHVAMRLHITMRLHIAMRVGTSARKGRDEASSSSTHRRIDTLGAEVKDNTLAVTEPNGLVYLPNRVFNLQLRGHLQYRYGAGIASSPTLCSRLEYLLFLFIVVRN